MSDYNTKNERGYSFGGRGRELNERRNSYYTPSKLEAVTTKNRFKAINQSCYRNIREKLMNYKHNIQASNRSMKKLIATFGKRTKMNNGTNYGS